MSDWNHNIHYHDLVLRALPSGCRRALDVGCGRGLLARRLARSCAEVVAIDLDHDTLVRARNGGDAAGRITFLEGDVMTRSFAGDGFDLITAVATLHHLPLEPALTRFRDLLRPGGVVAIVGLYRARGIVDFAWAAAAVPASWALRCLHRQVAVGAPVQDPKKRSPRSERPALPSCRVRK